jgi:hypothetical protein
MMDVFIRSILVSGTILRVMNNLMEVSRVISSTTKSRTSDIPFYGLPALLC